MNKIDTTTPKEMKRRHPNLTDKGYPSYKRGWESIDKVRASK